MAEKKSNAIYKTLAKDTGLFALSSFGSKILVFLLTPLYTHILATEEYGIADLINTTIHFIYPVLTLAIADATLRYALDKNVSKNAVLNNSMFLTILSTLLLMLCYPVVGLLGDSLKEYWTVFVVTYTLFNIHNCFSNFIKGIGKTMLFAIQGIIHTVVIITCNVLFLVVFQKGLDGYLLSIIIGYTVPILVMFFAGKLYKYWNPLKLDWEIMKDMLKYSIPMIPTLLAWAINTSIDKYMIIGLIGLGESGVYSIAHKIPTVLTTVLSIFTQAWQLSAISNHGSKDESKYYTHIYNGLNIVSVLACMAIIGVTQLLAGILFAKDFYIAWTCVPMLVISAMFSSHAGFLAAAFRAAKKTNGLFVSVVIGSVVNIVLNFFLIQSLGIVGASFGTAAGFIVLWLVRFITVQKIVPIKVNLIKTVVTYALMMASACVITFSVKYAYVLYALSLVIIVMINFKEIKDICVFALRFLSKGKSKRAE